MKLFSSRSRRFFSLLSLAAFLALASGAHANDVRLYGVVKGKSLTQIDANPPSLSSGNPFLIQMFVDLCAKQGLTSATVSNSVTTQTVSLPATNDYSLQAAFATSGDRDTAYPDGTFTMTLNAVSEGTKICALTVGSASDTSIPDPHVTNWVAAQTINADSDFKLMWAVWSGGTTNDFIQFTISDDQGNELCQSPGFTDPQHLNGTSTSFVIPKHALMAGQTYANVTLFFARGNFNTGSYPGVPGIGGYFRQTSFTIKTVDVINVGVIKSQQFKQTGTGPPSSQGFQFSANVNSDSGIFGVSSASAALPAGSIASTVTLPSTNDFSYEDSTNLTTTSVLNGRYANGSYSVTVNAIHDGTKTIPLSLPADNYPGTPPRISNFTAAQTINAGADFTFFWDTFSGATTNDFIQFQIKDNSLTNGSDNNVFNTGQLLQSDALKGTNTFVTVPANTLSPGNTNLTVKLIYAHYSSNLTAYPGVVGFAAYAFQTKCPVRTLDVEQYSIVKGQIFSQTSAGAPASSNFVFNASVKTGGTGQVASASVQGPTGPLLTLDPNSDFSVGETYADKGTLDTARPSTSSYTMTINTVHDGTKNILLPLPSDNYPAAAPQISNFAAAQAINSCTNFTLTWGALGGTASDFVKLEIEDANSNDTVFKTPELGVAGVLNGTNTSVVIPADTLSPGRTYQARLLFAKANYDTTSYVGITGFKTFFNETQFPLVTTGTLFRPKMQIGAPFFNNQFQLNVDGENNRSYVLDSATNLLSAGTVWSPLSTNWGSFGFTDFNATNKYQFYRVREGR